MKTFLGIGAGPIQTGIFVSGASAGGFGRIVLADVDAELVAAIRKSASITVNTAGDASIRNDTYKGIEIFNPSIATDLEQLKDIAQEAIAVATALPSTAFYRHLKWLGEAFSRRPEGLRYVYAAENSTTAATELEKAAGIFPRTYYLDTVIGKMSKIFSIDECQLPPLEPGLKRGHLVESFNEIYTGSAPGVESLGIVGLHPKADLEPFEEAKLYGHNATHLLLAILAERKGCRNMGELIRHPELLETASAALKEECGAALCGKFAGLDPFFTPESYNAYADELVRRMVSPLLNDSIERVMRDMERKLSWNDRLIGAIRLCLSQNVKPARLASGVAAQRQVPLHALPSLWREDATYSEPEGDRVMEILDPVRCCSRICRRTQETQAISA